MTPAITAAVVVSLTAGQSPEQIVAAVIARAVAAIRAAKFNLEAQL